MKKKYTVSGGAGFIGSNLVDSLVDNGHKVDVIDNFSSGKKENCNSSATYHSLDISDSDNINKFSKIMQDSDGVFHLAALARVQPSILDPVKYEKTNTLGTVNLLKSAADSNVKRFVYSASSSAYGNPKKLPSAEYHNTNPISPYAAQKFYGEVSCKMFSQVYGIETVSLRYFNVYGERQNLGGAYATVVGIFINQCLDKTPMTINGSGNNRRDYTYVGDVVNANLLAMTSPLVGSGEVINIGSGKNLSTNEVAEMIGDKKTYQDPVVEPKLTLADINKAKDLLGWEPKVRLENWILDYKKNMGLK
jgi:UDP-glucose 4-epimerase